MSRMFQVAIDSASATTQRDLIEIVAGSGVPIRVHEVYLSTDLEQDANEAMDKLKVSRFVGAFTSGSGGATAAAYALGVTGATEDSATCEVGNTTQITGGTEEILAELWVNNRIGWHYLPTPEARPTIDATDAFVVGMQAAFAAATAVAGWAVFEELIG